MRMGKYRVVFRRIEENEARGVGTPPGQRLLVAAVIPRDHLIDFIGDTQT
jgi:hypothetical protein